MSLWYDLKKKSYATNGKESWIKSYCDRIIGLMGQKLLSHFDGTEGRHKAEDVDFDQTATVKERIEEGFNNCLREDERMALCLETEESERKAECEGIRAEIQNERAKRLEDDQGIRAELQNEIQTREDIIDSIRADISYILSKDELKEAIVDENDSSVLCIDAKGNYSAEGLEISFQAPCSKSELSRIDLTLSIGEEDIDLMSEVEPADLDDEIIDVPELDDPIDPIDPIEPIEPVDPAEKVESFTFKSGKDFEEGDYVTVIFSGTTAEVKEVCKTGYFDYRISKNEKKFGWLLGLLDNYYDKTIENIENNINILEEFRDGLIAGDIDTGGIILRSSTEGSNKRFSMTIDDDGTITVTELLEV